MSDDANPARGGGRTLFRIRGPRDFYGGLVLVGFALLALWAASGLPGQQGFAFGPGTAPRLFAGLLILLGVIVTIGGLLFDGPPIEGYAVRGPFWVVVAILAFAFMIRGLNTTWFGIPVYLPPLGLVPATFATFLVSLFGSREMRWIESLLAAVAMTVFCVVLFVYLLELPFQLWPGI